MSITNYVFYTSIIISILSIISIVFAIRNRDKKNNKYIIIGNIIFMLYLCELFMLFEGSLNLNFEDFGALILGCVLIMIGEVLYLISIIICLIKRKKLNNITESKKTFKLFLIIVLIPIILFAISLFKEVYLINNSTVVLTYSAWCNGAIAPYRFSYAISDKYCEKISFDAHELYNNKFFLTKKLKEFTNVNKRQEIGYEIIIENEDYILVYKNNDLIHKKSIDEKYYNIHFQKEYYIE